MTDLSVVEVLKRAPVIPVIVVHELAHAVPLAEALVEGGLPVLEVTLRTQAGLAAIENRIPSANRAAAMTSSGRS